MSLTKNARINKENLKAHLQKFISSKDNPKFFFTMTEINKVGVNIQSRYNTPLGVYAYPLTNEFLEMLIGGHLPYAGEKPYVNLFTLSAPTFNMTTYTATDLKKDTNTIKTIYNFKDSVDPTSQQEDTYYTQFDIDEAFRTARTGTDISKMWNLTRILSKNAKSWNVLLRTLGYTNFYDPGLGLIHPNEPSQAVILDPSIIIVIESFFNPHASDYPIEPGHASQHETNILSQKIKQKNSLLRYVRTTKNSDALDRLVKENINSEDIIFEALTNKIMSDDTFFFIYDRYSATRPEFIELFLSSRNKLSQTIWNKLLSLDIIQNNISPEIYTSPSLLTILENLASKVDIPIEFAKKIAEKPGDPNIDAIKKVLALNEAVPTKILEILSKTNDRDLIYNIVRNPNSDDELIKNIILGFKSMPAPANIIIHNILINRHHISDDLFKFILSLSILDRDSIMTAIHRKEIQPEILDELAENPDYDIKRQVAMHEKTHIETLKKLFNSNNRKVISGVLNNPELENNDVRELFDMAGPLQKEVMSAMSRTPSYILNEMLHDPNSKNIILENIATNAGTTPNMIDELLAKDPGLKNNNLIYNILDNHNTSADALIKIMNTAKNLNYLQFEGMAKEKLIYKALSNYTSDKDLWSLSDVGDPTIRLNLIENRNLPKEIVEKLTHDSNDQVRKKAINYYNNPYGKQSNTSRIDIQKKAKEYYQKIRLEKTNNLFHKIESFYNMASNVSRI